MKLNIISDNMNKDDISGHLSLGFVDLPGFTLPRIDHWYQEDDYNSFLIILVRTCEEGVYLALSTDHTIINSEEILKRVKEELTFKTEYKLTPTEPILRYVATNPFVILS